MAEIKAYNEALWSGRYAKPQGLLGKYDNVRRFWEDEEIGFYLRPFTENIVSWKKAKGERLRVLDMGCGSGDGLEIIPLATSLPIENCFYKGVDINEGLLKQAQEVFGERKNLRFAQADFNELNFDFEEPYDLYLANYATLSHNSDDQTVELLSEIASHGKNGAIIFLDWLGRYSYEWQPLWTYDWENNQLIDYVISYIYPEDQTNQKILTSFPYRIMAQEEVINIYQRARELCGGKLSLRKLADRSSFVGRHQDTARYNPHCKPIRRFVNRLFEPKMVTDLSELIINYCPQDGFEEINDYYQELTYYWNFLVSYAEALLEDRVIPPIPVEAPQALKRAINALDQVTKATVSISIEYPRAFLLEPQLAYCLRELEMELQRGLGCGHSLMAILEVIK